MGSGYQDFGGGGGGGHWKGGRREIASSPGFPWARKFLPTHGTPGNEARREEDDLLQGLLKDPQFQGLFEDGSSLSPDIIHLGLPSVHTLQESPDHRHGVDLVRSHG